MGRNSKRSNKHHLSSEEKNNEQELCWNLEKYKHDMKPGPPADVVCQRMRRTANGWFTALELRSLWQCTRLLNVKWIPFQSLFVNTIVWKKRILGSTFYCDVLLSEANRQILNPLTLNMRAGLSGGDGEKDKQEMRQKPCWEFPKMKRILGWVSIIRRCLECLWTRKVRDFFNLVPLLSLSPISAFQKQETDGAISASPTWIKSNGISLGTSEIVRQTIDTCEGVRNAGDPDVIIMIVYVRVQDVKQREKGEPASFLAALVKEWMNCKVKVLSCAACFSYWSKALLDTRREKIWKNN